MTYKPLDLKYAHIFLKAAHLSTPLVTSLIEAEIRFDLLKDLPNSEDRLVINDELLPIIVG